MYACRSTGMTAVTLRRQGLRSIQSSAPKLPVRKYDFDWHFMLREMRDVGTVEAIWQKLESLLPDSGLACGVMEAADAPAAAESQPSAGTCAATCVMPVAIFTCCGASGKAAVAQGACVGVRAGHDGAGFV